MGTNQSSEQTTYEEVQKIENPTKRIEWFHEGIIRAAIHIYEINQLNIQNIKIKVESILWSFFNQEEASL